MKTHQTIGLYRLVTAAVVAAAVITQLVYGTQTIDGFSAANFFSFFTIESNIIGAAVFGITGIAALKKRSVERLAYVRGGATLYMTITGIVYVLLLSNADVQTPLPWVNLTLHYIFPVIIMIDWLLDNPVQSIRFKKALIWLVFPLLYGAYSLIRGASTGWYPYPFLNVDVIGLTDVLVNCLFIAVGGLLAVGAIVGLAKLDEGKRR
jgi:hypothetical protein